MTPKVQLAKIADTERHFSFNTECQAKIFLQVSYIIFILSDVDVPHPDEKSIITYVSSLYDVMPRIDMHDGLRANVSGMCITLTNNNESNYKAANALNVSQSALI